MFEIYEYEGQRYEVSPDQLEKFFMDFPNATKVGKTIDSASADPGAESSDMGSILENGSLVLPKAKDKKEIVRNLSNIQDAVTYNNDPILKQNILDAYFDTSKADFDPAKVKGAETIYSPMGPGVDFSNIKFDDYTSAAANTAKNYFGEDKYKLYQNYLETGDLNIEEIPDTLIKGFNKVKNQQSAIRAKELKDKYLKENKHIDLDQSFTEGISINEEVRGLYPTEFIEKYKEYEDLAKGLTDPGMVSEMGYVDNKSVFEKQKEKKKISEQAVKAQNDFLKNYSEVLKDDYDNYEKYLSDFNIKTGEDLESFINNPEIDINTRKEVLAKSRVINKRLNDYKKMATKFEDKVSALDSLDQSFDWGYRAGLSLENAIFGDIGLFIKGSAGLIAKGIDEDAAITNYLRDSYKEHINYSESLKQKREANLPTNIKVKDVTWNNAGQFIGEQLADNIFSVGTGLGLGGVVSTGSKIGIKYAKRAIVSSFVGVEGGAKLSEMEIAQKNAAENIKFIDEALSNENITPDDRLRLEEQREHNEKALNYTQAERAFSALTYGGIAAAAERMGTMRFIEDLYQVGKTYGKMTFKNMLRGSGNFVLKGPGTEILEETATQIGHNLMDQLILKEDKSLIEGLDPDFFASVFVTSMAIGGPGAAKGVRNAIRGHFQTKEEIQKNRDLAAEYIENKFILEEGQNLSQGGIDKRQADFIKARNNEILEEIGMLDIQTFNKAADLDANQVTNLFEINRKQKKVFDKSFQLGAAGKENNAITREQQRLSKEYNDLQAEKEKILRSPNDKRTEKLKQTAKEQGLKESDAMKQVFNMGQAAYNDNLAKGLGRKVIKFDGENAETDLNKYFEDNNVSPAKRAEIMKGFKEGGNGTFNGNDILTFENNRRVNMLLGNDLEKADAMQVAIHELQHMYDMEQGLVKDGKVIASHKPLVTALKSHVKDLYDRGKITKKTYNQFKSRVDQYSDKVNKNKVVDQTELLTMLGTMKRAGLLKEESSSPLYAAKSFINKVRARINNLGDNHTLLNMKTTSDVLRYIDSFNKKVEQGKVGIAQAPPEDTTIKQSKEASDNVQRIYEEQGEAGAMDIIEQFKPITSKIVERRSEAPNFDRQLLTDEIETGKRGIFDLIREYDAKSGVPLAAFINKYLPARAIEASKRVLGEEFTEDITEKVDIVTEEVTTEVKTKPKKKKIVLADRLGVTEEVAQAIKKIMPKIDFNRETFKTLKNQIPEITGGLFGISPKKIKNLANLTKKELQSAQMFINKNADLLINMLPEGATTGGTATGVPQTLLKAFYTKSDRAKMVKTGSKAGLAIQQKNKIDKKQFLETFGFVDGKPIRTDRNTSARVLALANLTGKMITNQAVRQSLISGGKTVGELTSLSDGKSVTMFSLGSRIKITGPISEQAQKLADKIGKKATYENMVKAAGIDIDTGELKLKPIDLTTEEGRQEYIGFIAEVLAPIFPKDVLLAMSGSFARGDSAIEKANKNKFLFQNKEQFEIFLETLEATGIVFGENMTVENQNDILNAIKRESYGKATSKTQSKKMKDKELKASKKRGFKLIWETIQDNIQEDQRTIPGFALMLSSSSRFQGHFTRTGAVIDFVNSLTGKNREEHTSPITALGKYLFLHAITGDLFTGGKNSIFENATKSYFQGSLPVFMDNRLKLKGVYDYSSLPPIEHLEGILKGDISIWARYFHPNVNNNFTTDFDSMSSQDITNGEYLIGGINPNVIELANGNTIAKEFGVDVNVKITPQIAAAQQDLIYRMAVGEKISKSKIKSVLNAAVNLKIKKQLKQNKTLNKAIINSRKTVKQSKGITVLDFDDTLATTESLVKYTTPDGKTGTLNAEQFASTYEDLQDQGYTFDFSDFNKVVKGKLAPLFNKAIKLQGKFGPENMFVLTARPPAAQKAIFDFLKANGLNIPLKNITGLGNSTSEAKALWIADKVGEGYNDFYFADDALQNVQAVKNMLDQFDVKSKVQQAKVKFSKGISIKFNDILQDVTGIESQKRFSDIKARKRGESKGKFRFFIPPSHEDFVGLLYNFMGKGKQGNEHRDFFEEALVRPLNRGYRELDAAKQAIANDYKSMNKQFPDVKKKLTKKTPDGDFTFQDAIRVYLWNKHGHEVPGLSPTDMTELSELVAKDPEMKAYAETLNIISKQDDYVKPTEGWEGGNIRIDLIDATGRVGREQFFTEFNENVDEMFSPENLNKVEAAYGKDFRSALEDMIYRIKTGINRPKGQSATVNKFINYLNGSVGSVMFFNTRSALLQQMSNVNYLNFADNNIFAAAKAFANQPQYWQDFAMIFNSDMLKQRRGGIGTDINGAELAEAVSRSTNPIGSVIGKLLQLGFLPTQIGDNIAIATGGATFYRNRVNKYIKDGLTKKEAEKKAFTDFQTITQATQQSARPDMTSQQQAMWIGKLVLNFLNTPSQYNRIIKKAGSDIINRRITPPNTTQMQSDMSNMSRILYYGAAQNLIFYSLQTALFALMFGTDDEDDDKKAEQILKKKERVINGAIDTILRGSGIYGVAVSTLKNMLIKFLEQREKGYNKDESAVIMELLNFSPVVGIKARKIVNAEKTLNYNKKVIKEMETFDIDNPMWSAVTNYIEATTNAPVNRLYNKSINLRNAADNQYTALQRALFFAGYTTWSLNLGDTQKMKDIKQKVKGDKKEKKKKKKSKTREWRVIRRR